MSTRWYPLYQRGNPQLRIFLPNFWMKILKPELSSPPNVVHFEVSLEMTKHDVKNYLEKIYKLDVIDVDTRIALGRIHKAKNGNYLIKDEDQKLAFVTLPKDQKFEFPDIFTKAVKTDRVQEKQLAALKKNFKGYLSKNNRPGVPSWYGF